MRKKIDKTAFANGWGLKVEFTDPEGNVMSRGQVIKTADGEVIDPPLSVVDFNKTCDKQVKEVVDTKPSEMDKYLEMFQKLQERIDSLEQTKTAPSLDISTLSEEIAKASRKVEGKPTYDSTVDPEDWLDIPVIFSSYGIGYYVFDDRRNGRDVKIPGDRPSVFKFAAGKKTKIGKVESYSAYCMVKESSKKRIQWLREHSKYGKEFFENTNLAMGSNVYTAERAVAISKNIDSWGQQQIIAQCKTHGITLGGDFNQLKTALHNKLLSEAIEQYKNAKERELNSNLESQTFAND